MSAPGGGNVLNLIEVCAELAEKGYRPEEIEKLDRWWIAYVISHPRGERGELKLSQKKSQSKEDESPFGKFKRVGMSWGKPDWLIATEWEAASTAVKKGKTSG